MISAELIEIMGPALAVGFMIAFVHAPLGMAVLNRGIIFIDLAIAQIAGLGFVIASLYFHNPPWWVSQGLTLACALFAGLVFRWIERERPEQQEAVIGSSFVLAASLAILLLANHPNGGEEFQHLLSGQILFVTWRDVLVRIPVYGFVMLLWFLKPEIRKGVWFFALFALAITTSVQLVGVYVVFASLILPALASVKANRPHMTAWFCGLLAVLSGILLSTWLDLPAGPFLAITYAGACCLIVMGRTMTIHD